jgi:hypothetical protein
MHAEVNSDLYAHLEPKGSIPVGEPDPTAETDTASSIFSHPSDTGRTA